MKNLYLHPKLFFMPTGYSERIWFTRLQRVFQRETLKIPYITSRTSWNCIYKTSQYGLLKSWKSPLRKPLKSLNRNWNRSSLKVNIVGFKKFAKYCVSNATVTYRRNCIGCRYLQAYIWKYFFIDIIYENFHSLVHWTIC